LVLARQAVWLPRWVLPCEPAHVTLFEINERDVPGVITQHDVIHVGGNTANMPDVWRRPGSTGRSASGLCLFEGWHHRPFGPAQARRG
jgi:hypothetical protein